MTQSFLVKDPRGRFGRPFLWILHRYLAQLQLRVVRAEVRIGCLCSTRNPNTDLPAQLHPAIAAFRHGRGLADAEDLRQICTRVRAHGIRPSAGGLADYAVFLERWHSNVFVPRSAILGNALLRRGCHHRRGSNRPQAAFSGPTGPAALSILRFCTGTLLMSTHANSPAVCRSAPGPRTQDLIPALCLILVSVPISCWHA